MNWLGANQECEAVGGYIPFPKTIEEGIHLRKQIQHHILGSSNSSQENLMFLGNPVSMVAVQLDPIHLTGLKD